MVKSIGAGLGMSGFGLALLVSILDWQDIAMPQAVVVILYVLAAFMLVGGVVLSLGRTGWVLVRRTGKKAQSRDVNTLRPSQAAAGGGSSPKVAKPELHFYDSVYTEFGASGQPNFIYPNCPQGVPILKFQVDAQATGPMLLETVELSISNHQLRLVGWNSWQVEAGYSFPVSALFEMPTGFGAGRHTARLTVQTDNGPWSPKNPFTIELPHV